MSLMYSYIHYDDDIIFCCCRREFDHVFGNNYLMGQKQEDVPMEGMQLLAIPTNQRAREDLVNIGDHIECEKDRLLNVFMQFGASLCEKLRSYGFWADYIDPCSGLPVSFFSILLHSHIWEVSKI